MTEPVDVSPKPMPLVVSGAFVVPPSSDTTTATVADTTSDD